MAVWRKQCNEWRPPPPLSSYWIEDEEAKMVKAWEFDGAMLFLWKQTKDLCLCLYRWHHLSTIPYIRHSAVLRVGPHFFSTDPTLRQWLAWNFTEAAGSNELVKASQQTLKLLLCCRSPLSSNMSLSNFLSSTIPTGFVMHQEKEKERKLQIPVLTQFCFICS